MTTAIMSPGLARVRRQCRRLWRQAHRLSPAAVTAAVALFYLLFSVLGLALHDWNPFWFVWLGERFAFLDPAGTPGYDGQFVYFIARDGLAAAPRLDIAVYRLQRILLPALVRSLALGQSAAVPWLIPGVNALAIVGATFSLANWYRQREMAVAYAATYGLFVGLIMAYSRDLTEPLALSLALAGAVAWQSGRRGPALILLAAAALTKEITLLFLLGILVAALLRRDWLAAGGSLAAAIPLGLWQLFLWRRLGHLPLLAGSALAPWPLGGLLPQLSLDPGRLSGLLFVAIPASGLLLLAARFVWRDRGRRAAGWWLLGHALFALMLPTDVYDHIMHAGRNAGGLVVAAMILLPDLPGRWRAGLSLTWIGSGLLWLWPILRWAPVVLTLD